MMIKYYQISPHNFRSALTLYLANIQSPNLLALCPLWLSYSSSPNRPTECVLSIVAAAIFQCWL